MKKTAIIITCTLVFSGLLLVMLSGNALAQNEQDATLYFYGSDPNGEGGWLDTEAPTDPVGESEYYVGTAGVFLMFNLGSFETDAFAMSVLIDDIVTVRLWAEQWGFTSGTVQFICKILIDGEETGIEFESNEVVLEADPIEIVFQGYVNVGVGYGEIFGIFLQARYRGTGWYLYWGGEDCPSAIVVPAKWADVYVSEPEVDYETEVANIDAEIIHTLGTEEVTDYFIEIEGPSPAINIAGPSILVSGDMTTASWTWYWGNDGASEGVYEVTVTVLDKSGNYWDDSEAMELDFGGGPPPPPPPTYWECTGSITPDPNFDEIPALIQDSEGTYWVAWTSDRSGNWDIWIKSSSDGINWGTAIQVTTNVSTDAYPTLIQDSSGLYWLTWSSDRTGTIQVWMSYSADCLNWAEPYRVTDLNDDNFLSSMIQSSSGEYYVAFTNINWTYVILSIYIMHSSDGNTWTAPLEVTTWFWLNVYPSLIQDDNGEFWIAYDSLGPDSEDVMITRSSDGVNWDYPIQVTPNGADDGLPSLIQKSDGGYQVAFVSTRSGDAEIWVMESADGENWGDDEQVTEPNGRDKFAPSLIQDMYDTLWVAYEVETPNGYDIYLSYNETNTPPRVSVTMPSEELSWNITIEYRLYDDESDLCEIEICYTLDDINYYTPTQGLGGDGLTNLVSSPDGIIHYFVWDSGVDLGGMDTSTVQIWIRPSDNHIGTPKLTNTFHIDNNLEPSVNIQDLEGIQSGDISISYTIFDTESDSLSIYPEYSLDDVEYHEATTGQGGHGTTGLSSSPYGITHTFIWDSEADLEGIDHDNVFFRITPSDADTGESDSTEAFEVDNNDPPEVVIEPISGEHSDYVSIYYTLFDPESDLLKIDVEYSQNGEDFFGAARGNGGDPFSNLASSPEGTSHEFVWDSRPDLEGIDDETVNIRITPMDNDVGTSSTSNTFHVDNNKAPEVEIVTPSDVQSGDVLINYILMDEESDISSIITKYSKDGYVYYSASMGSGGDGRLDLASSGIGEYHTFVWNSESDLAGVEFSEIYFRITAKDNDEGLPATTSAFGVDNKDPKIIFGPDVLWITETSVTIEWETDEPCCSVVNYGLSSISEYERSSSDLVTAHSITITGLSPGTGYIYCVSSVDQCCNGPAKSKEQMFYTEEHENTPPLIAIISPLEGQEVKGKITVNGTAIDIDEGDKVEHVEIRIDDGEWGQATDTLYWYFDLDTKSLGNGKHTIYARAYDRELYSEEVSVTIRVNNPEEDNIWLFVGIGGLIIIICVIFAGMAISRSRRSQQSQPQFVPVYSPETVISPQPPISEDFETEPVGPDLEW